MSRFGVAPVSVTAGDPTIDVCVCTFRRESLDRTLRSLAAQQSLAAAFRVIVADNDDQPSAQPRVDTLRPTLPFDVVYLHAPARNISLARNACLDRATAPWIAFIDDDEEASTAWLASLLQGLARTDADALFGPVRAVYAEDAPSWLRVVDLHSTKPKLNADGSPVSGYTSNVIVRRASVGPKRFDPARGRSGGEDTLFFDDFRREGRRMRVWPAAIVNERVPPDRASFRWLLRRSYRNGQTHAEILRRSGIRRWRMGCLAVAKGVYCVLSACGHALVAQSRSEWRKDLHRGALHLGVLASTLGRPDLQLYGLERERSNVPS